MVVVAVNAGGGGWCHHGRVVNVVVDRWHAGGVAGVNMDTLVVVARVDQLVPLSSIG